MGINLGAMLGAVADRNLAERLMGGTPLMPEYKLCSCLGHGMLISLVVWFGRTQLQGSGARRKAPRAGDA